MKRKGGREKQKKKNTAKSQKKSRGRRVIEHGRVG